MNIRDKRLSFVLTLLIVLCVTGCTRGSHQTNQASPTDAVLEIDMETAGGSSDDAELGQALKPVSILPDVLHSAKGRSEDSFQGTSYHLAALDLDITVTEGYYLYVVPGMYLDAEKNKVTLEFVDEYILTMKPVAEAELVADIRSYLSSNMGTNLLEERGPGYIIGSFKVFRREYLPIVRLYISELVEASDVEYCGDYCVIWGGSCWTHIIDYWLCLFDGNRLDPDFPDIIKSLSDGRSNEVQSPALIPEEKWPLNSIRNAVSSVVSWNAFAPWPYSAFYGITGSYIKDGVFNKEDYLLLGDPLTSVINPEWYRLYCWALQELNDHPEKYTHTQIQVDPTGNDLPKDLEKYVAPWRYFGYGVGDLQDYKKDWSVGWHLDESSDSKIRAAVFANLQCRGEAIALKDLVVLQKNGSPDYAFVMRQEPESGQLLFVDMITNDIGSMDLQFAYEYAQEYLK